MLSFDDKFSGEGLTYDDVLLLPAYSEVLPREVDTSTRFSRDIKLNIPIVTAAMDTVTDAVMAIAIAQEGGIGVLHKNLSIEDQAIEVKKVKRAENGMILDPITLNEGALVADALGLMKEYSIGGIPVVDAHNKLVGIVTNRDLRFERNMRRPVYEVMTHENLITTQEFTDFEKAADILQEYKIEKLPVVDSNYKLVGLITYKDIIKIKARPNACKDERGRLRVAAAVGVTTDLIERVSALVANGVDAIVIDTAHGHSKGVMDAARLFKQHFKDTQLIVGNIGTAEAARDLSKLNIDGLKVGIGPGSICTTRIIAGIGIPHSRLCIRLRPHLKAQAFPLLLMVAYAIPATYPKPLLQVPIPLWPAACLPEWKNHREKPSFTKAGNIKHTAEWALLKPCRKAPKTVISRIPKMISVSWSPKVLWAGSLTKALCPKLFISS